MRRLFADTSGWFSLFDRADLNFSRAVSFFKANSLPLVTTNYIFAETVTLLTYRLGHRYAQEFGDKLLSSNSVFLYRTGADDEFRAWEYFKKYSDKDYSYADCVSFIVMKKFMIKEAFTFDRHFSQAGFRTVPD